MSMAQNTVIITIIYKKLFLILIESSLQCNFQYITNNEV